MKPLKQSWAGEKWVFDGRGVVFHPGSQSLLLADWHLDKGFYLQRQGSPLPAHDALSNFMRLEACLRDYPVRQLILLGDSFHSPESLAALPRRWREQIHRLAGLVPKWIWLEGNHDQILPAWLPGEVQPDWQVGTVRCQHDPRPAQSDQPVVAGHYHPVVRVSLARRRLRARCFVVSANVLILPAFGQYTGGLDVNDEAIRAWLPKEQRRLILVHGERVYPLPRGH